MSIDVSMAKTLFWTRSCHWLSAWLL